MNVGHVSNKNVLVLEHLGTDVACKRLDVTNAMYSAQVKFHLTFRGKLPATNLTAVRGVRSLWSARALSLCRDVVSADL